MMNPPSLFFLSGPLACMLLVVSACSGNGERRQDHQSAPVILAAASLQEAMEDIADAWAQQGHIRPSLSFAGTPTLARQVENGAPADVIMLADEEWMDALEARGLLKPGTRHAIVSNRLVIIAPVKTVPAPELATLADLPLALGSGRLAMGDPDSVPAGRYARAALRSLGLWDRLKNRLAPAESVRAAMALVERGEAPFGIVYASDLAASPKVRQVAMIDGASHPQIRFPAAVLDTSRHPDGPGFLAFLRSDEAARVYVRHHFTPMSRP